MKYLSNKKGFLGIDNKSSVKENVVVIPFGLEKTVSYGSGTSKGPKEIIKASHQVELFDEDLNKEPYKYIGIKTLKPFPIKKNIIDALKQIENINKLLLDKKKFPLVLGGEHSLTPGAIRPFVKKPFYSLGTDGFGRSDTREKLRNFFEVDKKHIVVYTLSALAKEQLLESKQAEKAIKKYKIDQKKIFPTKL